MQPKYSMCRFPVMCGCLCLWEVGKSGRCNNTIYSNWTKIKCCEAFSNTAGLFLLTHVPFCFMQVYKGGVNHQCSPVSGVPVPDNKP